MRAVIFDLDGTLSDPSHRLHHVKKKPINWTAFFDAMGEDPTHEPILWLLQQLWDSGVHILLATGRPENYRGMTKTWLEERGLEEGMQYHALYMRPENDHRPDHVVKGQILDGILAEGFEVMLVVDDRQSVVDMWRARGLTCLQCRKDEGISDYHTFGRLTLMVGPSGAGKSTWLDHLGHRVDFGIEPQHIINTDQIRRDLCGDAMDQTQNDRVFEALHAIVRTRISHGLPTVVDATNIRRKDRLAIVGLTRADAEVRYIVIDRPMDEKMRDGGWRLEVPNLIGRHDQVFRSNLIDILKGDDQPNVKVFDQRTAK